MGVIKEVIESFKHKDEVISSNHGIDKDETEMGWNIYTKENVKRKEFSKDFHRIHSGLKHKAIIPGLFIAKKFMKPYVHEGAVPNSSVSEKIYNREFVVFERAYNKALEDWCLKFYFGMKEQDHPEVILWRLKNDRDFQNHLKTIKQLFLEVCMMDTAYHEFGAFLMHRIHSEMVNEFNGEKYGRIIYNKKNMCDVHWFLASNIINDHFNKINKQSKLDIVEVPNYESQQNSNREIKTKTITEGSTEQFVQLEDEKNASGKLCDKSSKG